MRATPNDKPPQPSTEEHVPPTRSAGQRGREALVTAFPTSLALPVPLPREAIGREWLASHGVEDTRVSTRHAVFSRRGGLGLEDAGSRNGTWVNGSRLAPGQHAALADGALIRIGRTLLVYRDNFRGRDEPSAPIDGSLVGPFGLRAVAAEIEALRGRPLTNVLIEGETGTGKELAARAVAAAVGRARPYGAVNMAGLASGVFEAQLFGYVPGAYSGSGKGSPGVFREHEGGAVFLDELGELPADLQAKLLRVLENHELLPVGGVRPMAVDVFVIAATNRSLDDAVATGVFRRDLLARLATRIELPALRDRSEDLFAIAQAVTRRSGEELLAANVEVEALERVMLHDLPANVRELASVLARAFNVERRASLKLETIEHILGPLSPVERAHSSALTVDLVVEAIRLAGSESEAARRLGISRGKLRRFLLAQTAR